MLGNANKHAPVLNILGCARGIHVLISCGRRPSEAQNKHEGP